VEGETSHGIPIPTVATLDNTRDNNETLLILYFNAQSLIPKLDELCALVEIHNPDVISIEESWLCGDIPDNEISIPHLITIFCIKIETGMEEVCFCT